MEQTAFLSKICADMDVHLNKTMELLEKSEGRIDRTNEAVVGLMDSVKELQEFSMFLTGQYIKHIEVLSARCDKLIAENARLMEFHTHDREVIESLHQKVDDVMRSGYDKLLGVLSNVANKPHVSVDNKQL